MTIGGSPCIPGDISLSYSGGSIPDSIFWKSSPDAQPEQVNTIILDGAIIWQGNLRPQKVVFYPDTSKDISDQSMTLFATSVSAFDASLPLYSLLGTHVFSSSNESIASVSGGDVLTFHSQGVVDITASQAGNSQYLPASETKTITIEGAPVISLIGGPQVNILKTS